MFEKPVDNYLLVYRYAYLSIFIVTKLTIKDRKQLNQLKLSELYSKVLLH